MTKKQKKKKVLINDLRFYLSLRKKDIHCFERIYTGYRLGDGRKRGQVTWGKFWKRKKYLMVLNCLRATA